MTASSCSAKAELARLGIAKLKGKDLVWVDERGATTSHGATMKPLVVGNLSVLTVPHGKLAVDEVSNAVEVSQIRSRASCVCRHENVLRRR